MGLFNLLGGGISFGTSTRGGAASLADSKYQSNLLKYPIDLGSADKGHYILININEQTYTSFPGTRTGDLPRVLSNRKSIAFQNGGYDTAAGLANASKIAQAAVDTVVASPIGQAVKVLTAPIGNVLNPLIPNVVKEGAAGVGDGLKAFLGNVDANIGVRTISRITDTIALYMPSSLNFAYSQAYSDLRPGGTGYQTALSVLNSASDTYKSGGKDNARSIMHNLSPFILNTLLQGAGPVGQILFTAASGGKVQNPMLELLYTSPEFRTFQFDFLMFPRSEKEALEVQNIINKLRFHQAPELVKNSGGFFLYPPSEFDISFYYNGQVNPNIPKISTCVLTNITTDYAPGGFAAYEVEGEPFARLGRTGMPVGIRLSLSFKETEYLVKGSPLLTVGSKTLEEVGLAATLDQLAADNIVPR